MNHSIFLCQSQIVPSLEVVDQEAHDLGLWWVSSQVTGTYLLSYDFHTTFVTFFSVYTKKKEKNNELVVRPVEC